MENNFGHKKLEDRLRRIDEKLEQYLSELNQNDDAESDTKKHSKEEIESAIAELQSGIKFQKAVLRNHSVYA